MKKTFAIFALLSCCGALSAHAWTYDPALVGNLEKEASGTNIHSWNASGSGLTWHAGNPFSIAITLDIASLDATSDYAVFSINAVAYNGLAAVAIQQGNINFYNWNVASPQGGSIALDSLGATETLTLVISKSSNDGMSLAAYADGNFESGTTRVGTSGFAFSNQSFTALNFGGSSAAYLGNINDAMPGNDSASAFNLLGAGYMTGGVATGDQLRTYYADIIPEPATATLGMLLLAGLSARRRRK